MKNNLNNFERISTTSKILIRDSHARKCKACLNLKGTHFFFFEFAPKKKSLKVRVRQWTNGRIMEYEMVSISTL